MQWTHLLYGLLTAEWEGTWQVPCTIVTVVTVCPQLGAASPFSCLMACSKSIFQSLDSLCLSPSTTLPITLLDLILFSDGVSADSTAGEQRQCDWQWECCLPARAVCVILKESYNFFICRLEGLNRLGWQISAVYIALLCHHPCGRYC